MKIFVKSFCTILIVLTSVLTIYSQENSKIVRYSDYGAKGDGVTDDFDAIVKAHAFANKANLPVQADTDAIYYIGGADKTAIIQTNTDWKNAKFIFDDTKVEKRNKSIFSVTSKLRSESVKTIQTLKKDQKKLDLSYPHDSFIVVTDQSTKHFIRYGANQNNGSAQTDVLVIDKSGNINGNTPLQWDFDKISSMTVCPIDDDTLTIHGGHFTTIANQEASHYNYYARGINITRSNVIVKDFIHTVTEEKESGAPYGGFITILNCANVIVQNGVFCGHKIYRTIGSGKVPVSMGSYDISVGKACNITFKNCRQINDIHDSSRWGVFGSNFTKNITFDTVMFSRFDAHQGVFNATIKNSSLGHQGINLIGGGTFLIENSKVYGTNFINLRSDYGSTFNGNIIIRNCEYTPRNGATCDAIILNGSNSGQHDFGYTCYMPRKISIDGLVINDSNPVKNYQGPKIFGVFNSAYQNSSFVEKYPYIITKEVQIRNLTVKSGKPYLLSNNAYLFRNVKVTDQK